MAKKRANGEGGIRYIEKSKLWRGEVTVGYTEKGTQKRKYVYGKTQKEAREKLDEVKRQLSQGTFSDTKLTVKAYLEQWLIEKSRDGKIQTAEDYRYQLERYVVPRIGRVQLTKLTPLHVQRMCGDLADTISPQRANKCRRVLSTALNQAVRWQLIVRNPCDAVKPFSVEKQDMQIWNAEEATRFIDTARPHRLFAAFYLAMSTGLRRGELLGLRWQDVEGSSLVVRQSLIDQRGRIMMSTPKTKRGARRVALSPDVMDVLEGHRKRQEAERKHLGTAWPDTNFVFTSKTGTCLQPRSFSRTWHLLQERAGVRHVRLHDLRHLHASLAVRNGMNAKVLADRLGHAKASFTLDVYTHLFEEQRANSAVSIMGLLAEGKRKKPN